MVHTPYLWKYLENMEEMKRHMHLVRLKYFKLVFQKKKVMQMGRGLEFFLIDGMGVLGFRQPNKSQAGSRRRSPRVVKLQDVK